MHLHSSIVGVGDALKSPFPSIAAIPFPFDQELTPISASVLAPILIDRIETELLTKAKAGAARFSESVTVNIYTLLTREVCRTPCRIVGALIYFMFDQHSRGLGSEEKSRLKCALEAISTKDQMLHLTFHK